jgi:hypothetical protein
MGPNDVTITLAAVFDALRRCVTVNLQSEVIDA